MNGVPVFRISPDADPFGIKRSRGHFGDMLQHRYKIRGLGQAILRQIDQGQLLPDEPGGAAASFLL